MWVRPGTNTLAYHENLSIAAVKSFIELRMIIVLHFVNSPIVCKTPSITTIGIIAHNTTLSLTMFSIITLDTECCYAESHICSIVMLSPVMLNVARLSVVMLSVVVPVLDDLLSESRDY